MPPKVYAFIFCIHIRIERKIPALSDRYFFTSVYFRLSVYSDISSLRDILSQRERA